MNNLQFVKLGGSLITDKDAAQATLRPDVLSRLVDEIAAAQKADPTLRILLGHGSGSFAHRPAKEHGTRAGVHDAAGWQGFVEVWRQAAALNRLVMDALASAGIHALAFPPSAAAVAEDGRIATWPIEGIKAALDAGLLPVVYGDVAFDSQRGGTILSTEDLFIFLADAFSPQRILLAGDEDGIYADYPARQRLLPTLRRDTAAQIGASLGGAAGADVTGGMAVKVDLMLDLLDQNPGLDIRIFSGLEPGNLQRTLAGEAIGTRLVAD
jgi:isopentenyl phosphate kinase